MKKITILGLICALAAVTSCEPGIREDSSSVPDEGTDLGFKVICPQGAPAASFARYASSDNLTLGAPATVRAAFTSADSDFIIFDSANGNKLAGENYKLVRMVTFGNLYVMSTGNDDNDVMEDGDVIFSYGQGLVPDMAFKSVYTDITPDYYGADVSTTAAVMLTGLYEGNEVDYVVSSYPPIYAALNNSNLSCDLSVYSNVSTEFSNKYSTDGFPQAGLYIKATLETDESKADEITTFLSRFDADVDDLIAGADKAVERMNAYGDATAQAARFGFNSNVLKGVQATNALAFISAENNPSASECQVFVNNLGYTVPEGIMSSYYPTK